MHSAKIYLFYLFVSCAVTAPTKPESALRARQTSGGDSQTGQAGSYKCLQGTTFPSVSEWKSFENLKSINQPSMGQSADNILKAIGTFSSPNTGELSDDQFHSLILAQVMQETGGAANLIGDNGESHGLLQVKLQNGEAPAACDPSGCTYDNILKMLQQGINGHSGTGTPQAPGIAYWLGQTQGVGPAVRSYNSGSVPDASDLSVATPYSTESYVSDIGNRLTGISPTQFPSKQWLQDSCGFKIAGT